MKNKMTELSDMFALIIPLLYFMIIIFTSVSLFIYKKVDLINVTILKFQLCAYHRRIYSLISNSFIALLILAKQRISNYT